MRFYFCLLLFTLCTLLAADGSHALPVSSTTPHTPESLILFDWAGYMPQSILDAFTQESGIPVTYLIYDDQDEAVAEIRAGKQVDVLVLDNELIPTVVADGLLAELDYQNIVNFRYISPNFRDLTYDPENKYSIPIQWGTSGLVVRSDRTQQPITGWADLWNPRYAGRIGIWPYERDMIDITLKALGYSINSQDPAELNQAQQKLLALRKNVFLMDPTLATGVSYLMDDKTALIYGWSYDAREAEAKLATSTYVLPKEGTILWSDNVTIPANSVHKQAAEKFINFLLRPEISAQMVNELWVATPNSAARPFIAAEILSNPAIYPPNESLKQAEFEEPASEETKQRYEQIWDRFLAAGKDSSHQPQ